MPKLTDAELVAAIEQEERQSIDTHSGELHQQRVDALARYRGELLGDEIDGRSQVVDMTMLDTIESIMPGLVSTFMGGEDIGEFEPRGPEDEAAAKAETDVVNWMLNYKNDLFSHVNACLRDALLLKNGYIVAYWQTKTDQMVETYKGLSDEEAAMLAQDPDVQVIEHSEYPDPSSMAAQTVLGAGPPPLAPPAGSATLHDIKIERKKADEFVQVEAVPPDELLVSRRHRWTSLLDCDFVQWRRRVSIGQLRNEGFDVPDDMPAEEEFTQEWVERQRFNEALDYNDETPDPSRRMVIFKDTYIRIDLRGEGVPQLWRVCVINGSKQVILKDEADVIPFAAFSPIIYPHSHIGSSIYDQVKDISLIKLTLQRQLLDGVYLQNSGQMVVNTDAALSLDDFLVSRPGGIKRVQGPPSEAVMPLQVADNSGSILQALQYMDDVNVRRTGIQTNAPNGLDQNSLNSSVTATAVQAAQSQSGQRSELIARTLVSGFRDLFCIVHALMQKHSTKPLQIKLDNEWQQVNPREWTRRTDFKVNVGLGTGSPQMKMAALQAMGPIVQQSMQMGLAGPQEAYHYGCELWKAAGYPVYERFLHAPQKDPQTGQPTMPPPPPNPLLQVEQMKGETAKQIAMGKGQMESQLKQHEMGLQDQAKQRELASQLALQQSNDQRDAARTEREFQLKRDQIALEMQQKDVEHQRDMELALKIEHIKANTTLEVARIQAGIADAANAAKANADAAGMSSAVDKVKADLAPQLQALHAAITAPRTTQIVRDPVTGKAQGAVSVHPHAQTKTVQ